MSGTQMGSLKSKLGLKGQTKPGEMISRMNQIKGNVLAKEVKVVKPIIKKTI